MEDLKKRLCTLSEADVGLNLYDFVVRRPGQPTEKYGLRAYDELILAPMCLFEPRVIDFDKKRIPKLSVNVTEEILEHNADLVTSAMVISTQHLIPDLLVESPSKDHPQQSTQPDQQVGRAPPADNSDVPFVGLMDEAEAAEGEVVPSVQSTSTSRPRNALGFSDYSSAFTIDVRFEASKLPLDVAIYNSARAAGGDDKIRKYLQAVLVVGGTARLPGMAHALESRLHAIVAPVVANMEKVQIIPAPKEVDPSVLTWKGAAVLGKMEGVSDLWVTRADWDTFGMRSLKERCYFL